MFPFNMDDVQPPAPLVVPNRETRDKRTRNVFFGLILFYIVYGIYFIAANINSDPEMSRTSCEASLNAARRLDGLSDLAVPRGQTVFASLHEHWPILVSSGMLGLGVVMVWMTLLRKYSLQATYFSLGVCACIWIFYGVALMVLSSRVEDAREGEVGKLNVYGIASLFLGGLIILFMVRGKKRIQVTANMITWSTKAVETFPKVFAYFLCIIICLVAFAVFFASVMVAHERSGQYVLNSENSHCQLQSPLFPAVFFPLVSIWIIIFANTVRTSIIAGTTAIWYFHEDNIENFGDPVGKSARWALVEAAGSNALAALVVALCELLDALTRRRRSRSCAECVCMCILGCIKEMIKMFTKFSVIMVAITGESLVNAGKISLALFSSVFVDGFITDRLARVVLAITSFMLTYLLYVVQLAFIGVPTAYSFSALPFFIALIFLRLPLIGVLVLLLGGSGFAGVCEQDVDEAVCREAWSSITACLFCACLLSVVLQFVSTAIIDAVDTVFVCFAIDRANGTVTYNKQELHQGVVEVGKGYIKVNPADVEQISATTYEPLLNNEERTEVVQA